MAPLAMPTALGCVIQTLTMDLMVSMAFLPGHCHADHEADTSRYFTELSETTIHRGVYCHLSNGPCVDLSDNVGLMSYWAAVVLHCPCCICAPLRTCPNHRPCNVVHRYRGLLYITERGKSQEHSVSPARWLCKPFLNLKVLPALQNNCCDECSYE